MTGRLLVAEWRKATTTKLTWLLCGIAVAYSVVQAVTLTLIAAGLLQGVPAQGEMLKDPAYIVTLLGQTSTAATFVLVLGIIAMTGEFRHMTITTTFLGEPRRWRIVAAKMVLYAALGAGLAVVTLACVLASSAIALAPFDHAPITATAVLHVLVGAIIGLALYALLGVGLGAVITNQVAAIVTALIWTMLVEALVGLAFPATAKWLPSGALSSAMGNSLRTDVSGGLTSADRLPTWGGILLLLSYATVLAVIGARTTLRRDIT
jgi:ABC-type transport system involved in multi-copper enzyme maturation permease subunit